MAPQPPRPDGKTFLAAVTTVAAVYVYFLIFAQFGFLKAVEAAWGGAEGVVHSILGGMGLAGIAGSVIAAKAFAPGRGHRLLATGFVLCALAAGGTPWANSIAAVSLMALSTGLGVGLVTVTLAGVLRPATGDGRLGLIIGLGTGLAYGFCNLPGIFDAAAEAQAWVAIAAAMIGLGASRALRPQCEGEVPRTGDYSGAGVTCWVLVFLGLVCFDSALFYFIQHTPELKQTLWASAARQMLNAGAHLAAAALAGWALDRQWAGRIVAASAVALFACGLWIEGRHAGHAVGALVYIASVSVYSTALVFYAARSGRPAVAALVYAVAGWGGSAAGIGLAAGRAGLPPFLPSAVPPLLVIGLLGRYFASRRALAMNENNPA